MKYLLTFLLIILFSSNSFTQKIEELPEIPWRAIVETENRHSSTIWQSDIYIKLMGNFSTEDSIMIENAVEELNKLIETIELKVTNLDRGNFEIYFLDSLNDMAYRHIISIPENKNSKYYKTSLNSKISITFTQAIKIGNISKEFRQNYLTNTLAFALYSNYWNDYLFNWNEKNRESNVTIYRAQSKIGREELYFEKIYEFDKKLLKAVYSANFKANLKVAKKQFQTHVEGVPSWIKVNPFVFSLIPFGIIILIIFPLYLKTSRVIGQRISSSLLSFNINGLIGIVLIGIIVAIYYNLAKFMKLDYYSISVLSKNLFAGVFVAILLGLPAINLLRLIELLINKSTDKRVLKIVLIFLSTGLLPFSVIFAIYYFTISRQLPGRSMGQWDIRIMSYFLLGCLVIAAFRAIISYFFFKEKDLIIENETKLSNLRELKSKAELNALHSRINPHFLYNSLNSIAGLAHNDADKTEHMALSLSKLFRYSINKEKSDWTTFNEELEMVKIYLDVEKVRFDDRLTFWVEIPKELEEHKIPRFIIQPLVENAVKHGISKSVEGGEIKVRITKEGKSITIAVSDSGQAFPGDLTPGFGIQSIYDKLEILYKDKFEMNFTNSPQKQVTIRLK